MGKKLTYFIKNNLLWLVFLFEIVFFRTAVADWSYVPSGSMEPTFYDGDYVLVNKTSYGPSIPFTDFRLMSFGKPQRGDIITFYPPHIDKQYVKRVIGIPGDRIHIEGLAVYVKGEKLALSLAPSQIAEVITAWETVGIVRHKIQVSSGLNVPELQATITVPDNRYFVRGDHRNNSMDSRYWGFVDEARITGKVTRIAFSFAEQRSFLSSIALKVN